MASRRPTGRGARTPRTTLRARAVELRGQGWSVNDIALEIGVARSTAWQWVKHLPLDLDSDRARMKREHARMMSSAQWDARRRLRDERRAATQKDAAAAVGDVSERELLMVGAAIYWCEGKKSKPWRPHDCRIVFTNSDAGLVRIFLAFLERVGVERSTLTCRVTIHESADALAATRWWAERLDIPLSCFKRPTLKRHRPTTNRLNTGLEYRGCVVIDVRRSREIYWRIEGIMAKLCASSDLGDGTVAD